MGDESIMAPKAHGTSATPVQQNLKWSCDRQARARGDGGEGGGAMRGHPPLFAPRSHELAGALIPRPCARVALALVAGGRPHLQLQPPLRRVRRSVDPRPRHALARARSAAHLRTRCRGRYAGYWESTTFIEEASKAGGELTFYDSNTGKPLFVAPRGRTLEQFVKESRSHGWCARWRASRAPSGRALPAARAERRMHPPVLQAVFPRQRGRLGERARAARWRDGLGRRHAPRARSAGWQGQPLLHKSRVHRRLASESVMCVEARNPGARRAHAAQAQGHAAASARCKIHETTRPSSREHARLKTAPR